MTKIALIICYIGKLPSWMNLWIESVKCNPTIDFYIFTDQKITDVPNNIKVIKTDINSLRTRFSKVLGFEASLETAYKLCDYKPLYGEAFAEYLIDYNFWGYCDIDLIFGDIRKFITEDILNNYDKILEMGHFSLYRNTKELNQIYRKSGAVYDYRYVYTHDCNLVFDEIGIPRICKANNVKMYTNIVCADIDPKFKTFIMMSEKTVNQKNNAVNHKHQIFVSENNRIYRYYVEEKILKKDELMYVHFMRKNPVIYGNYHIDNFIVTFDKFINYSESVNVNLVYKYDYSINSFEKAYLYLIGKTRNFFTNYIKQKKLIIRVINKISG